MNFDAIADIFDAVLWQIETVTPFLQSDFTVAVSVIFVEEISDAMFQRFQRGDEWKQFRPRDDSVFGRVHLAEFPQNGYHFRVFGATGASVHVREFNFELFPLVQRFHHIRQPHGHPAGESSELLWFALTNLFASGIVIEMVVIR